MALTIVGFAVGSLFGLLGGLKRLAWNSGDALARSITQRAAINAAQIREEVELFDYERYPGWSLKVDPGAELERPERPTVPLKFALESYRIVDGDGVSVQAGARWLVLEVDK